MKIIGKFKNNKELAERGNYWKNVLGLQNWVIKFILCTKDEMKLENVAGECESEYVNRMAVIRILKDSNYEDSYFNQPQEQVLIHELLHAKIIGFDKDDKNIEDIVFEIEQHRIVEDLSKALIQAKYEYSISDYHKNLEEK